MTMSSNDAVDQVLKALANVVGLHVIEVWMQNRNGFGLVQTYVASASFSEEQVCVVERYHNGEAGDNAISRNMCKRAMQSKHGFFWLAKSSQRLHQHLPIHTAVSYHIPRDNINRYLDTVCASSGRTSTLTYPSLTPPRVPPSPTPAARKQRRVSRRFFNHVHEIHPSEA